MSSASAAIGCRIDSSLFEDLGDRASAHIVAQVLEGTLNP